LQTLTVAHWGGYRVLQWFQLKSPQKKMPPNLGLAMKKSTSSVQFVTWGVMLVDGLVLNLG